MLRTFERLPAFPLHRIRDMKDQRFVRRFIGIRPLYVTVVIPTIAKTDKADFRQAILNKTIYEIANLIDIGIVDELVIIDGSESDGEPDTSQIEETLRACYARIGLFKNEVDLIRGHPGIKYNIQRGYRDLCVKAVHQRDPNLVQVLSRFNVTDDIPRGKGSALWTSVPLTRGDIIVYVDSDIKNFSSDFVLSLLGPTIQGWNSMNNESDIKYVKAYYSRLGVNIDEPNIGQYVLGGRACRLFAKPLFTTLARNGCFRGLDQLQYPLSGEFAGTRRFFESIDFVNGYGIEVAMLCQAARKYGVSSVAQVNFEIFQHLSQKEGNIQKMVGEIADTILHHYREYWGEPAPSLVDAYMKDAKDAISEYMSMTSSTTESMDSSYKFFYDEEEDTARIKAYSEILSNSIQSRQPIELLPNWRSFNINIRRLRYEMRRQATLSTFDAINRAELGL